MVKTNGIPQKCRHARYKFTTFIFRLSHFTRMRRLCFAVLIFLALLVSGCSQPAVPVATPSPTMTPMPPVVTAPLTLPPAAPVQPPAKMQINVTAWQNGTDVNVQYNGGADSAYLTALKMQIDNRNGATAKRTIDYPVIGGMYTFTYLGTADADTVNVIGVFKGGTEQTVLFAYV